MTLGFKEVFRAPGGLAIVFPLNAFEQYFGKYGKTITNKYHLVRDKEFIHMYIIGHITKEICDEFIDDYAWAYRVNNKNTT